MIAQLNVVLSDGGEYAATNSMPAKIRSLMDAEGYAINQDILSTSAPDTNSLRHFVVNESPSFDLFELAGKKKGWSIWNNSDIQYFHRNNKSDSPAFSQFEYDIYYPFHF